MNLVPSGEYLTQLTKLECSLDTQTQREKNGSGFRSRGSRGSTCIEGREAASSDQIGRCTGSPPYPEGNVPVRFLETERRAFVEIDQEVLSTGYYPKRPGGLEAAAENPLGMAIKLTNRSSRVPPAAALPRPSRIVSVQWQQAATFQLPVSYQAHSACSHSRSGCSHESLDEGGLPISAHHDPLTIGRPIKVVYSAGQWSDLEFENMARSLCPHPDVPWQRQTRASE